MFELNFNQAITRAKHPQKTVTYFVLKVINYRGIEKQNKERKSSEEIVRH